MILTEELARYILSLQNIADLERGLDEDELKIKNSILNNFPKIKKEVFREEFETWLWEIKVQEDQEVKILKKQHLTIKYTFEYASFLHKLDTRKRLVFDTLLNNGEKYIKEFKVKKCVEKMLEK